MRDEDEALAPAAAEEDEREAEAGEAPSAVADRAVLNAQERPLARSGARSPPPRPRGGGGMHAGAGPQDTFIVRGGGGMHAGAGPQDTFLSFFIIYTVKRHFYLMIP